ncbi:MAG: glycosyltransferase family 2 protein [Candidatus Brocadiia bacterium]
MPAPDLTIAIIHHGLRGYPQECIESLAPLPPGTELLLVQTESAAPVRADARVISVRRDSSRAAAKNLAVAEARGECLLLAAADTVSSAAAVERLRKFVGEAGAPVVASARLLQENGMPRRTGFALPSIAREVDFFDWLWRQRRFAVRSRKPPVPGPARRVQALHAAFLMARRETFRSVGEFAEGYRFAFEDLEWSWRAGKKGVALCVCPEAPAYKLAPQLMGELSPEISVALEASQARCVRVTRGAAYARAFRATRAAKSLGLWLGAAGLNGLFCGASEFLKNQAAVHRAVWKMRPDAAPDADLPEDVESRVRWETFV